MRKSKAFCIILACLLTLCFTLVSCDEYIESISGGSGTKTGTVKVKNGSTFKEDSSVEIRLIRVNDNFVLGSRDLSRNKTITWTEIPPRVYIQLSAIDSVGNEYTNWSFSLYEGQTAEYTYTGTGFSYGIY